MKIMCRRTAGGADPYYNTKREYTQFSQEAPRSDVDTAARRRRVIVLLEFYVHPFRFLSWMRPANPSEIGYSL